MSVLNIPREIVDFIASLIDSPKDLLALALTCRHIASVFIPRHTQFRVIRCSILEAIRVWRFFIRDRSAARNVRSLSMIVAEGYTRARIEDHEHPLPTIRVPSQLLPLRRPLIMSGSSRAGPDEFDATTEKDLQIAAERLFLQALENMRGLTHFHWGRHVTWPVIDSRRELKGKDIWTTLASLGSLRSIDIVDPDLVWTGGATRIYNSTIWGLANLTSFRYQLWVHSGSNPVIDITEMKEMLHDRCPNLETLNFTVINEDERNDTSLLIADDFLTSFHWRNLRRVCLQNVHCSVETVDWFLETHHSITDLEIDEAFGSTSFASNISLPRDVLPNLQRLASPINFAIAVMACPSSFPRPIERIEGVDLTLPNAPYFFSLLSKHPTLRHLIISRSNGIQDVEWLGRVAKGLTWLEVGTAPSGLFMSEILSFGKSEDVVDEWIRALSWFPRLLAFHGVDIFGNDSYINDEIAAKLSEACPRLRRINAWESEPSTFTCWPGSREIEKHYVRLFPERKEGRRWEIRAQDVWWSW